MKQKNFKKWFPKWVFPLLILLAIGTVWVRLSIVRTTYQISQKNQEIRKLEQGKEKLDLKVTALRSPRRLENIARVRFGLSQPRAEQIVHLTEARGP